MKREKRSYFSNKYCFICHKPANIYILVGERHFYSCNNKVCDYKMYITAGWFPVLEIKHATTKT